jgi:flagellin
MASVINTNIASLNAQRNLTTSQSSLATSLQRLSSGLRINSAKDDAAGLAISERFSTQIRGMNVAARNANDGISLAQSAEGAMTEIGNNLQRIRELAVQSRNATNSTSDRKALDAEVQQLKAEIGRVAENTSFNGTKLLDGTFTDQVFQVGANQGETINISGIANAKTNALGQWSTAAETGTAVTTALEAGDLTINGIDVGAVATADAKDMASAINKLTSQTNVTATATNADVSFGAFTAITSTLGTGTYTLSVGGVEVINDTAGGVTAADLNTALGNAKDTLAAVGITFTGEVGGTGDDALKFTRTDGSNIAVTETLGGDSAGAGFADLVDGTEKSFNGKLTLTSFSQNTFNIGGDSATSAGLTEKAAEVTTNNGFKDENVQTSAGADRMIVAMDAALTTLNSARADMGAVQNRFSSVVTSLQTTSENLSASRSRILDTDFAAETANLTRGQILQQAGTAMLAQANSLPNGVLALLRG